MTLHVYALFNSYIEAFDAPFVEQADEKTLLEGYRRSIFLNPQKFYDLWLHEKTLMYLGEFDDVKGILTPIDQPKSVKALAGLFPPGFLAQKESLKDGKPAIN